MVMPVRDRTYPMPARTPMYLLLTILLILGGCTADDAAYVAPADTVRASAQTVNYVMDDASTRVFREVMDHAQRQNLHERPIGEVMQELGLQLRGKPYVAGILDEPGEESLICRLDGFDCVTFVETAFAMARAVRDQDYSEETFRENVLETRYRAGEMDGYCSRIHYFTEWVVDNQRRGLVDDVTEEAGGRPLDKQFNFMTENRDRYPRLVDNDVLFECIQEMEAELATHTFHYIPQQEIRAAYPHLQAGDILALVTDIEGLDVTHTGLVYANEDGSRGLLHASTSGGVIVSPDLQGYVTNNRRQIGILVARPAAGS